MRSDDLTSAALVAVEDAWGAGCPVAGHADQIAPIAVRRWTSSHRRKIKASDTERRIEDLAKGLVQQMEDDPRSVGPLMKDYRFLASKISNALMHAEDRASSSP